MTIRGLGERDFEYPGGSEATLPKVLTTDGRENVMSAHALPARAVPGWLIENTPGVAPSDVQVPSGPARGRNEDDALGAGTGAVPPASQIVKDGS